MPTELTVGFDPRAVMARVSRYSQMIRSRVIWLVVTVVVCLVIWLTNRSSMSTQSTIAIWGVGLGYSLLWLLFGVANWANWRRILGRIGQGVALRIGRWGIDIDGAITPWDQVSAVTTKRGTPFSAGATLAIGHANRFTQVPWLFLDTLPGTVDAAVRAYSLGHRRLDTSHLDN